MARIKVWRDTRGVGEARANIFVSHAGADRAWAEWVAWQLIEAGYTVELDLWDWAAGRNFVTAMSDALERCDRVVALFSAEYFDRSRCCRPRCLHVVRQRLMPAFRHAVDEGAWVVRVRGCWGCYC